MYSLCRKVFISVNALGMLLNVLAEYNDDDDNDDDYGEILGTEGPTLTLISCVILNNP